MILAALHIFVFYSMNPLHELCYLGPVFSLRARFSLQSFQPNLECLPPFLIHFLWLEACGRLYVERSLLSLFSVVHLQLSHLTSLPPGTILQAGG